MRKDTVADAAVACLLFLSSSFSSFSSPWGYKEAAASASPKLFAAATGTGGDQALPVLLAESSSAAR